MLIQLDNSSILNLKQHFGEKFHASIGEAITTALKEGKESIDESYIITLSCQEDLTNLKAEDILLHLNLKTEKSFKFIPSNIKPIKSLLKDYSPEEIKNVIDYKVSEWIETQFNKYLQPSTLYRRSNFENYVQQFLSSQKSPEGSLENHFKNLLAK